MSTFCQLTCEKKIYGNTESVNILEIIFFASDRNVVSIEVVVQEIHVIWSNVSIRGIIGLGRRG